MSFAKECRRLMGLKLAVFSAISCLGMREMFAEFKRSRGPVCNKKKQLKASSTVDLMIN